MQKMTSAYANKLLRSLEEDKEYLLNQESESSTYRAAVNEEPVIPEYDYAKTAAGLSAIDDRICRIKHAVNLNNALARVQVGQAVMSVDTILIRMAQLNRRKATLDEMRKQLPKKRETGYSLNQRNVVPEYTYINYDLNLVKQEYDRISSEIMNMQMALDLYNQTVQFDVDI